MKKKLIMYLSTLVTLVMCSTSVYAKVDGIVTRDKSTLKLYEYGYEKLIYEAENNAVGINSNFYNEYLSANNQVIAFHDDVNGYIKFEDISRAAEDAVVVDEKFDLQNFVDSAKDDIKFHPNTDIQIRVLDGENVIDGPIRYANEQEVLDFDVLRIY